MTESRIFGWKDFPRRWQGLALRVRMTEESESNTKVHITCRNNFLRFGSKHLSNFGSPSLDQVTSAIVLLSLLFL